MKKKYHNRAKIFHLPKEVFDRKNTVSRISRDLIDKFVFK